MSLRMDNRPWLMQFKSCSWKMLPLRYAHLCLQICVCGFKRYYLVDANMNCAAATLFLAAGRNESLYQQNQLWGDILTTSHFAKNFLQSSRRWSHARRCCSCKFALNFSAGKPRGGFTPAKLILPLQRCLPFSQLKNEMLTLLSKTNHTDIFYE